MTKSSEIMAVGVLLIGIVASTAMLPRGVIAQTVLTLTRVDTGENARVKSYVDAEVPYEYTYYSDDDDEDSGNLTAHSDAYAISENYEDSVALGQMQCDASCNTATYQNTSLGKVEADVSCLMYVDDVYYEDSGVETTHIQSGPAAQSSASFEPTEISANPIYFTNTKLTLTLQDNRTNSTSDVDSFYAYLEPYLLYASNNGDDTYDVIIIDLSTYEYELLEDDVTNFDVEVYLGGFEWYDLSEDGEITADAAVTFVQNETPDGYPNVGTDSGFQNNNYQASVWFSVEQDP